MNRFGVVFDLDGVIVSTDELHYRAWKALADRERIPFDRIVNHRLRGVSRMESLQIVLERATKNYDASERAAMADFKNGVYVASLATLSPADVLPGVRRVLDALRAQGVPMAIGSSSRNARPILERIGLSGFFDAVVDGTEIAHSKPDPEVFLKAAAKLGLPPSRCLVVEDAVAGIAAARAAGMVPVAVGDAVKSADAAHRIASIDELIDLV